MDLIWKIYLSDDASWKEENKDQASFKTYIGLAAAGFINGVNPCGASMLLMLLAAIAMSGRSVIKTGCAYLAGSLQHTVRWEWDYINFSWR